MQQLVAEVAGHVRVNLTSLYEGKKSGPSSLAEAAVCTAQKVQLQHE